MIRRVSQLGSGITPSADNFSREQLAISCPRLFLFPFSLIDARNNFESRFVLFLLSVFPRLDSRFVFAFMAVSFFRIYFQRNKGIIQRNILTFAYKSKTSMATKWLRTKVNSRNVAKIYSSLLFIVLSQFSP